MTYSLSKLVTKLKSTSLDSYLSRRLVIVAAMFLLCLFYLLKSWQWQTWNIAIALAVVALFIWLFLFNVKQRILSHFERLLLHLEAIKVEDFNQFAKSEFPQGCTAELHQQLKQLSGHLHSQKSRYDQHAFLLYQLIDQLNTPIMVFNKKLKLTYANGAFASLYGQPWQMYRMSSPSGLGLVSTKSGWQLPRKDQQWQISQSEFIDSGQTHQLLVFTNIDSAIRASQQSAWQQILRVMGHEIRNSLTPVSSLAESLTQSVTSPREQQALAVIAERCQHLQDFLSRYSRLSERIDLQVQLLDSSEINALIERIKPLFPSFELSFSIKVKTLTADVVFLEQVLINLIKNAVEANANKIAIKIAPATPSSANLTEISIKDNGQGLANTDNLFVPLFTTKPDGQGIGLTFCRNVIEQHHGSIELVNNAATINTTRSTSEINSSEEAGVTVVIKLPNALA